MPIGSDPSSSLDSAHRELSPQEMYRIPWGDLFPDWVKELRLWIRRTVGIKDVRPDMTRKNSTDKKTAASAGDSGDSNTTAEGSRAVDGNAGDVIPRTKQETVKDG